MLSNQQPVLYFPKFHVGGESLDTLHTYSICMVYKPMYASAIFISIHRHERIAMTEACYIMF